MESKRGQSTGIATIIALVIGIAVVVMVVLAVTGALGPIGPATNELPDDLEIAAQACAQYAGEGAALKSSYCQFKERKIGTGLFSKKVYSNCDGIAAKYSDYANAPYEAESTECVMTAESFCDDKEDENIQVLNEDGDIMRCSKFKEDGTDDSESKDASGEGN